MFVEDTITPNMLKNYSLSSLLHAVILLLKRLFYARLNYDFTSCQHESDRNISNLFCKFLIQIIS